MHCKQAVGITLGGSRALVAFGLQGHAVNVSFVDGCEAISSNLMHRPEQHDCNIFRLVHYFSVRQKLQS